ncbi:MAG: cell division protein FtsL [Flavobacteriales bacterium]|jgi:cell division protein FtsL
MKNRVNLYHPEFHPKLRLLTLTIIIFSWLLTILFFSLLYFYLKYEQQGFKFEIVKAEQKIQQQKTIINEYKSAVDNLKVEPKLIKEVEKNQQLIRYKRNTLDKLVGQKDLKSIGFANLMIDLAKHNPNGLWLTRINLDGISVVMEGAATDSAIIPKWLNSLGQTDYFKGQEFANTRLYRDSGQQLIFVVSTGKGSDND